jgi:uncharacterized membrane protein
MRHLALALALFAAPLVTPVAAQPLPQLHAVTGVGAGDVLNVREAPAAGAPVVGTLAADARGVEVTALDPSGAWARVNAGERAGWAALRYLAPDGLGWTPGILPPALACHGTEPFWGFTPAGDQAIYDTPDAGPRGLALVAHDTGLDADPRRLLEASAPDLDLIAAITPADCNDGMSDRAFGLEILLLVREPAMTRLLSGCCSIAPRN